MVSENIASLSPEIEPKMTHESRMVPEQQTLSVAQLDPTSQTGHDTAAFSSHTVPTCVSDKTRPSQRPTGHYPFRIVTSRRIIQLKNVPSSETTPGTGDLGISPN